MRVVITGGGGQLARELQRSAPPNIEVHSLDRATCDITKLPAIQSAVDKLKPELVINAAAYTAVDQAESEKERAFAVNEAGARNVAEVARLGATVVRYRRFRIRRERSTPYLLMPRHRRSTCMARASSRAKRRCRHPALHTSYSDAAGFTPQCRETS